MAYPTPEDFKKILREQPLAEIVRQHLFGGTAYAFRGKPKAMEELGRHLSDALGVSAENIVVVGSAKTGFSLDPVNFPRKFSPESDIDVLVVSEALFDEVWYAMLRWNYPRRFSLGGADWDWSKNRRNDLYWGWFRPDRIRFEGLSFPNVLKPVRDISTRWFNAFRSLSLKEDFASRDVTGRLYRSWQHALLYQMEGLRRIKRNIEGGTTTGETR